VTISTPTQSKPTSSQRWSKLAAIGSNQSTILVGVLVILVVVFTILEPKFLSTQTASNILTDWGSVVLVAVGMTYVIISGGIDLSVGASIGLSGVVAAWFMVNVLGLSPKATEGEVVYGLVLGTIVAILTGLAVGLVNGFLITKARIPPFIATLATMGAVCPSVAPTTSPSFPP
jgi:ribose transport system permease protein